MKKIKIKYPIFLTERETNVISCIETFSLERGKGKSLFPIHMNKKSSGVISIVGLLLFFALVGYGFQFFNKPINPKEISYYQFEAVIKEDVKDKHTPLVKEYESGRVLLKTADETYQTTVNPNHSSVSEIIKDYPVKYEYAKNTSMWSMLFNYILLPALIIYFLIWLIKGGSQGSALKQAEEIKKKNSNANEIPEITLKEVGGLSDETKNEIIHMIEIIKRKEVAANLGIKPPQGALLHGPPGTGKTLLAKAIANELGATFYSVGGSSFMEMFVGVGASRVRELFEDARKNKPSLIFIDEVDAIAGKRGNAYRHEERENTLNELLKQLDGTDSNEDVFVIAATNRLDILDEAVIRPGRFDFKIHIGLPDLEGRKEIIDIHIRKKPLSDEVKKHLEEIAHSTTGYSGAEIEALFLMSANHAFSCNRAIIEMEDINFALDRLALGNEGRKMQDEDTKRRVAYHEAGHALLGVVTKPGSVRKATIIPRGGALGFVAPIPKELDLSTKSELIDKLSMILAGGLVEKYKFGEHSIGVGGDVQQANHLIEKMIELGMDDEKEFRLLFEEKEKKQAMQRIYERAVENGMNIIYKYKDQLETLTAKLLEKETLSGEEIEQIIFAK